MPSKSLSDREIEEFYDSAEYRITQEKSDFLLPQIVDFVNTRKWIKLRPEYQRRLVWSNKKKSLLIESLLMNVPIPPVFLYEKDLGEYEVMDGQQRLNTIVEFYENRFKLSGLVKWKILNGRSYADCPPRIQKGFDRRRISATVLLAESTISKSSSDDLRVLVFERLNTGGQNLNNQELRNCLYGGLFNDLIVELAGYRQFNEIWGMPPYEDNIRGGRISRSLMENAYFKRMRDCEIVLRFFAFRRTSKIRGAVVKILDTCMIDGQDYAGSQIGELRKIFISRLDLAYKMFGNSTFKISSRKAGLSVPLYDATMIAVDRLYDDKEVLLKYRKKISEALQESFKNDETYELIIARANTAESIKKRLDFIEDIFRESIR